MDHKKLPKRTRLKDFPYKGNYVYSVTICTHNHQPHFKNESTVCQCLDILKQTNADYGFQLLAYCFMPDHLHLLVGGQSQASDFRSYVSMFKQKTSYLFKKFSQEKLWQPSYYERVLRAEKNVQQAAKYIFLNPVRKELVTDYRHYPYLGSDVFDIEAL